LLRDDDLDRQRLQAGREEPIGEPRTKAFSAGTLRQNLPPSMPPGA